MMSHLDSVQPIENHVPELHYLIRANTNLGVLKHSCRSWNILRTWLVFVYCKMLFQTRRDVMQ